MELLKVLCSHFSSLSTCFGRQTLASLPTVMQLWRQKLHGKEEIQQCDALRGVLATVALMGFYNYGIVT